MQENSNQKQASAADIRLSKQYLTFMLGGDNFAMGILAIKEIIEFSKLTVVPTMPPSVRGVINLRGNVVPVIDLGERFGRGQTAVGKKTCIVIIELSNTQADTDDHEVSVMGVMVDSVNEVLDICDTEIEAPPSFGNKIRSEFIHAIGKINDRFVIILNSDKALAVAEFA